MELLEAHLCRSTLYEVPHHRINTFVRPKPRRTGKKALVYYLAYVDQSQRNLRIEHFGLTKEPTISALGHLIILLKLFITLVITPLTTTCFRLVNRQSHIQNQLIYISRVTKRSTCIPMPDSNTKCPSQCLNLVNFAKIKGTQPGLREEMLPMVNVGGE